MNATFPSARNSSRVRVDHSARLTRECIISVGVAAKIVSDVRTGINSHEAAYAGSHEAPDHILADDEHGLGLAGGLVVRCRSTTGAHKDRRDDSIGRCVSGPSEGIIKIARLFDLEGPAQSRLCYGGRSNRP